MNATTQLAKSLDVAPATLVATLDDAAQALRYERYYSFRNSAGSLRPILTAQGQQRLIAFLTPDDGAALARRGFGGTIVPMITVDDQRLLLALLHNAALGDLVVFEEPVLCDEEGEEPASLQLVTRARLLSALYQRSLLSRIPHGEAPRYVQCLAFLDQQGEAGDALVATASFVLWRLTLGAPPSAREIATITGAEEQVAAALLARALAAVQSWYSGHAHG